MSNPQQSHRAGGEKPTVVRGLSIVIEGSSRNLINAVSSIIVKRLQKQGSEVVTDKELYSNDERILLANQRLLDAAAITLAPETSTLFVAVKLQPRLRLIQKARSKGMSVVQSNSWLSDAVYYDTIGNLPVVDHILQDFKDMRPDYWAVIDSPNSTYTRLAKRSKVSVYGSDRSAASLASTIFEEIMRKASSEQAATSAKQDADKPIKNALVSRLAALSFMAQKVPLSSDIRTEQPMPDYYRLNHLGDKINGAYETIMNKIIDNHDKAVELIKKHIEATVGKEAKGSETRAIKSAAGMLPMAILTSLVSAGDSNKHISEKDTIKQDNHKLRTSVEKIIPQQLDSNITVGSRLISASPINELDLVSAIIYPYASMSKAEISQSLNTVSYAQKEQFIIDYLRAGTVQVLERVHYTWEIVSECSSLYSILESESHILCLIQPLSPRYGYDIPEIIEQSGAEDLYQQSFDLSMELYSLLQSAGYPDEAQYAVLGGHRVRYELVINANELSNIMRKKNESREFQDLMNAMREQVAEAHPLISSQLMIIK